MRNNFSRLEENLKQAEGFRQHPYRCSAGYMTIGYGRNLDANGISKQEAWFLLRNDVFKVYQELLSRLPWIAQLDEKRQDVLIEMAFNLGVGGLLEFKKTLEQVRLGNYSKAAEMMLDSRWARQVGDRAVRLSQNMKE